MPGVPVEGIAYRAADRRPRHAGGRLLALKIGLLLFFLAVALRLAQVQILQSEKYREIARRQYEAKVILPATRGSIYDRNGKLLVSNMMFISFGADPKMVGSNAGALAERFARVFGRPKEYYLSKLSTSDTRFVWLERRVRPVYSKRINAGEFEGLIELEEPQRLYPYDDLAGQLVGFTDVDNRGLSGIELSLDRHLRGTDGYVVMQRDGLGRKHPSVDYPRIEPIDGENAVLTIDLDYQAIAEEELGKGVKKSRADGGLAVMMDPATGEILAMANYPLLNPAHASASDPGLTRNRVVSDMFEPGSVFKIVTASAALKEKVVKPGQKFFGEHGRYVVKLAGGKERIINDTHDLGMITFKEAIEFSSNIVMAKVSDLVGAEGMYTTARDFGFGSPVGIDLPGEAEGELKRPVEWSGTTLNTMAYGYEVAATPLQIAAAYAAVANGGVLMRPFIVKRIVDSRNGTVEETAAQEVRRVISKGTARELTAILESVVEHGTGVSAHVPGLRIAGKTGTSRKFAKGKYEPGNYTASFVGFFPADDPKVVCLVMLDNPKAGGYTGGLASAPIFRNIAEKVYGLPERFMRKAPAVLAAHGRFAMPDVSAVTVEAAKEILADRGVRVDIRGNGPLVLQQHPGPGATVSGNEKVVLDTQDQDSAVPEGYALVPNVLHLAVRRAVSRLALQQLDAGVRGSGLVVAQSPKPGERVKIGTRVLLRCEPRQMSAVAQWF